MKRYAIIVSEYSAHYEDEKLTGWDMAVDSPQLLLFTSEEFAESHMQSLGESQDCDYKVEFQKIGWVNIRKTMLED